MLENIRDKARDNLYNNLMDLGIECEMSKRGIRADKLQNPWHRKSLGVIKINSDSPVEFINAGKKFADVVGDTDYLRNQFGLSANRISSAMRMLLENH